MTVTSAPQAFADAIVQHVHDQSNYNFTMNDRCDGDDGFASNNGRGVVVAEQAYHRWTKPGKEIFLCNHHNAAHEHALVSSGWAVQHAQGWDSLDQPLDINGTN